MNSLEIEQLKGILEHLDYFDRYGIRKPIPDKAWPAIERNPSLQRLFAPRRAIHAGQEIVDRHVTRLERTRGKRTVVKV
jgi:hypothetical protein